MADDSATGAEFTIGSVLRRSIGVITDNPVTVFGIAFLLGGLPSLFFNWFTQSAIRGDMDELQAIGASAVSVISAIINIVLQALVVGALTRTTVAYANGDRASIGESINAGLAVMLPLIGLSILMGLGILVGFMILLIPGIILYVMWSVAAPALVAERQGVMNAFGRSRELTRGGRWKVFGLLVILLVIYWIVSAIAGAVAFGAVGFDLETAATTLADGLPLSWIVVNALSSTLLLAVWSTISASLYVELRRWKEGPEDQDLAEIFA
jgi:hypothetical protein